MMWLIEFPFGPHLVVLNGFLFGAVVMLAVFRFMDLISGGRT